MNLNNFFFKLTSIEIQVSVSVSFTEPERPCIGLVVGADVDNLY